MSTQHTPGLLAVRGYSISTADGIPVADTCLTTSHPDNDHANALRLTACWNACDGLDTEGLRNLVAIGESIASMNDRATTAQLKAIHEANRLRSQREKLLEALILVLQWIDDNCETTGFDTIEALADAAIANATKDAT